MTHDEILRRVRTLSAVVDGCIPQLLRAADVDWRGPADQAYRSQVERRVVEARAAVAVMEDLVDAWSLASARLTHPDLG